MLGRSLDDLPPQTRRLLTLINEWVSGECKRLHQDRSDFRFSRRDVRQATGWGNTQLKLHLARLQEMEYLLVHRGERGQSYVYELLYEGQGADGKPFLMGLIDVDKLRAATLTTARSRGQTRTSRPPVGPWTGRSRRMAGATKTPLYPLKTGRFQPIPPTEPPNTRWRGRPAAPS